LKPPHPIGTVGDTYVGLTWCHTCGCHCWFVTVELLLYPLVTKVYEGVMSHMYESRPICRSHVTYGWVTSRMQESCPIWRSHVTHGFCTRLGLKFWASNHVPYEGVMSYGWVMSHIHAYILMSFCTSLVLKSKRSYVLMCSIRLWIVSYFPQKALIFHKNRQIFHETCHISIKYLLFFIHTVSRFHFHLIKNEIFEGVCPIWRSHVTYVWVTSHMQKSCHIWMSH